MKNICDICENCLKRINPDNSVVTFCNREHWDNKWEKSPEKIAKGPVKYDPNKDPWASCKEFEVRPLNFGKKCEHGVISPHECTDCLDDIHSWLSRGERNG